MNASKLFGMLLGVLVLSATLAGVYAIVTAKRPESKSTHAPAAAELKKVNEADLGVITLTEEAEQRLGVETAAIERKDIQRVRMYGGEVMVPVGKTIVVVAPMQGTLQAPEQGVPKVGRTVARGDAVFALLPFFSPEASATLAASKADVEGQMQAAKTQMAVAKLALDRAAKLYQEEAGSKRAVEEAQAQYDLAQRAQQATEARLAVLTKALGSAATGRAEPISLDAPEDGLLRNISALPGQSVAAGSALFEVVDLSEVWVRVPVYAGDLRDIATDAAGQTGALNMKPSDPRFACEPVAAPPSANPLAATVDLYYALKNDQANFTPGQRVAMDLTLRASGEALTAPWSAIVHDWQGGAWLYESLGERRYRRHRVQVRHVIDGTAVLEAGPPPGTTVVSQGAIELFGAETGFSK